MALSQARLEAVFEIRTDDQSARVIDQAGKRIDNLGKKTDQAGAKAGNFGKKFADAGDEVAGTSGRLSTVLSSLGDFAGANEGAFRKASEAAGAFDDVLTLLPGPVGLAAAAAAGLTTVLVLQAKEAERNRIALESTFANPVLLAGVQELQKRFDLTTEAAVALAQNLDLSGKSANDVRADLARAVYQAERLGKDGSAAAIAFANSLRKADTDAKKLERTLRSLRGVSGQRFAYLGTREERAENEAADKASLKRIGELRQQLRENAKVFQDALKRRKEGDKEAAKDRDVAFAQFQKTKAELEKQLKLRERLANTIAAAGYEQQQQDAADFRREKREAVAFNLKLARELKLKQVRSGAAAAARRAAAAQRKEAEFERGLAEVDRQYEAEEKEKQRRLKQTADIQREGLQARLRLAQVLKAPLAEQAALERQLAAQREQESRDAVLALFEAGKLGEEEARRRLEALDALHLAELKSIDARLDEEKQKRAKQAEEIAKQQVAAARGVLRESTQAIGAGADVASQVVGGLSGGLQEAITQFGDVKKVAPNALAAIGKAGAQFVKNERARAAILAVTSAADALRALATPGGQVQAALLGAAAVQYGLVAGGVLGGSGGGGTTAASAGAGGGGGGAMEAERIAEAEAGRVTNITFNGLFATEAQVAQAMQQTQKSLAGTGYEATP